MRPRSRGLRSRRRRRGRCRGRRCSLSRSREHSPGWLRSRRRHSRWRRRGRCRDRRRNLRRSWRRAEHPHSPGRGSRWRGRGRRPRRCCSSRWAEACPYLRLCRLRYRRSCRQPCRPRRRCSCHPPWYRPRPYRRGLCPTHLCHRVRHRRCQYRRAGRHRRRHPKSLVRAQAPPSRPSQPAPRRRVRGGAAGGCDCGSSYCCSEVRRRAVISSGAPTPSTRRKRPWLS